MANEVNESKQDTTTHTNNEASTGIHLEDQFSYPVVQQFLPGKKKPWHIPPKSRRRVEILKSVFPVVAASVVTTHQTLREKQEKPQGVFTKPIVEHKPKSSQSFVFGIPRDKRKEETPQEAKSPSSPVEISVFGPPRVPCYIIQLL